MRLRSKGRPRNARNSVRLCKGNRGVYPDCLPVALKILVFRVNAALVSFQDRVILSTLVIRMPMQGCRNIVKVLTQSKEMLR